MVHSWLRSFFRSMGRASRRRRIPVQEPLVANRRLGVEPLERRILLTVTSSFTAGSGLLSVSSDANDNIAIEISGGLVQINNAAPGGGPLAVAAVTAIVDQQRPRRWHD